MEYNKEYAKKVYAGLSKRGYTEGDLGSEDLFVARMGKENNRRLLYDMIARRGDANVGSWERFNERMSVPDTERELGLGGYQPGQPIPIIEKMRRMETEAGAGTPMGDDIYKTKEGQYTRTEVPFRTIEYPSLGMAQMAARGRQREDALAAYRSAYNRLEAPGEVDERTLIEWGNNMDNAPIEQKNLYTRIMGKDATNRVDLDAVMRSYDETKKSLEGMEDPEGLAAYLIMPAEQRVKLPEAERKKYEDILEAKRRDEAVEGVNELHNRLSSLMEDQRKADIEMHRNYRENRSVGQFITDAILGIPVAEAPHMQGIVPSSGLEATPEGKQSNEQNATLTAAGRKWNEMKYIINAAKGGNIFDGLDKALGSVDTWTSDQILKDNMAITRVANKFDKEGEGALTDNEKALLDALALNVAVSEMYGDEISAWYKGGEMIGEMAPFMIEMLMNPLSGVGKKAADKVTRRAIEKYGKELVKKKAGRFALKRGAAKLGASVAGATGMALTTGLPAVGADTQKRMLGDATYGYDDEGNIEYTGHVGGEDLGTSAYKAVTSRMLDNVSEMLGAGYAKIPFKWLQKAGKGTKVLGWIDNLANSKFGKGVSRFAEKTKWNGPIEEFLEEVHVGLLNPVLVGDQSWEEFFTADNLATIAIGVAVPGAVISTANTIAGAADGAFKVGAQERWKMKNAEAMGYQLWQDNPNEWNDLTNSLMGQMEDIEKTLKEVYNNPNLTPEQKKTALEYGVYSLQWRTAKGVEEAFNEGKKFIDPMLRDVYGTAYAERVSPVQANNAYKAMAEAEKNAQRVLGIGDRSVDEWLNGRTAEEAARSSKEKLAAIKAYQTAKLDFEGRRDRYIAEKERAYMESDRSIQTNDNNGMVYATQLEDEPVYITGGNVVLNEDGTIDVNNSSEALYVKFPDRHVEMTSPDKFTEVFTEDRTEDLKAAARAEIDAKWKAEFDTAEAQSVEQEKRDSGVVFNMTDAQGEHRIEILNEGENMSDILMDGRQEQISTEELNRWKQEAGIQSTDAVADNTTDNVAPTESEANVALTGDNVAPVAPVELPNVPDFFRLGGKNYSVASRNDDGSVDVTVDGKRETLPAGTDYFTLMPTDKKGEVQYERIPVERTHEYFVQKVKDDEARAEMIEKRRKKAEAERKKFDKKPDPGFDPDAYEAKMTQWEADKKAAQAKVDYWNEIAKREAYNNLVESVPAGGTPVAGQRNEGGTVSDDVQGGGQNGVAQEEVPVNKPVGETDNSTVSQTSDQVAEGDAPGKSGVDPRNMSYDERAKRGDMLRNAPAIDVNEGVITSTKELSARKAAEKWWDENVAEPAFYDTEVGEVEISRNSVESSLAHRYGQAKLDALTSLIEGFENAVYLGSMPDGTRHGGVMNHYFAYPINYKGERCYVFCRAMHDANKNRLYVHEVFIADRIKKGDTLQTAASQLHGGIALYKDILANVLDLEPTSASEDRNSVSNSQENAQKSGEIGENGGEIQEPRSVEENLDNGDKRITNYNSRGEVATVAIERDGKVVSVDSYDEGVLFEHTEYDGNGKATAVTRYDKQGNVVGTQVYENGKAKTPMQKLADHVLARAEDKRRIPLRERARELEAQVGVKANIIESLDKVKNREARERIAAGEAVAGWYSGGQVYLYMPNIKDRREIELTYVHEVVAHHGVKKLLGDRFNEFLDGVWNMMSEADRARMLVYVGANENPTLQDMRAAADEYVAELAEKMNLNELEQSTWDKIVDWFKELLENIGFENLTKEDIESILKASYANLAKGENGDAEIKDRAMFRKTSIQIENLFDQAVTGDLTGKPVSIGKLTKAGKEYLETISGLKLKEDVDFVLNPSDLLHIYNNHYGENEKDKGNNIPLNKHDIRRLVDVVAFPTKIVYGVGENGRKSFYFLMDTPGGAYNLLEIYADKRGNLSSKTYYKTKKGVSQRVMNILNSLHSTSVADGATLSNAKVPQMFENTNIESENSSENPQDAESGIRFRTRPMTKEEARQMVRELIVPFAKELREEQETRFRATPTVDGKPFHENSYGLWRILPKSEWPQGEPDYVSRNREGGVSSQYWYGEDEGGEYIIRKSDHWSADISRDKEAGKFMSSLPYRLRTKAIRSVNWALDYRGSDFFNRKNKEYFEKEDGKTEKYGKIYLKDLQFEDGGTRFRIANENQDIFVSNAQRAIEGIQQNKATAEQWIAMLKKNGGLKAGEDAWLGLEEWLNEKQGAVTKQEILDFIGENKIQIEEVEYDENAIDIDNVFDEYEEIYDLKGEEEAHKVMIERYGENFFEAFKEIGGELRVQNDKLALQILKNEINSTRLNYTTEGLENKREIALVVPAIESWNASDEIHFGDAGNGRAVAWVRFGETTVDTEETIAAKKAVNDYLAEMREKHNTLEGEETDAMTAEEIERLQELTAKEIESGEKKARVLVIDEIQSKRHQEGREKGYRGVGLAKEVLAAEEEVRKTNRELTAYREPLKEKYNFKELGSSMSERLKNFDAMLSEEERTIMDALGKARNEAEKRLQELREEEKGIPSAPFEKNWHELAMKRMLRLAAEEGFDKVAWTTGEQQAQRYDMSKVVSHIACDKVGKNGTKSFSMGLDYKFIVDPNGIVVSSKDEYVGKSLADIVGKTLANKMLEMQEGDTISGDGLRIGGEGMKGFYDKMLPSFVQKYTKKWGAKVGEVTMPSLEENNTMWSVDVTPEMQESVMQGQTMFRTVEETTDGSIDDVPAQPLTLMERITNSLLEVSAKNKENLGLRADALKAFGKDITRVLSVMKAQKEYDKSTVDTLVKLAKMYFKNAQLLGEVDTYTMGRVLSLINNVVGKRDVTASAAKLMDILLDAHTKALAGILDKAEKVKAKKVNAAGVEVMGRLDKYGQKRVDEYRAAKEMPPKKLEEAIYDSDNRLAELEQRVREELGLPEGDVDQATRDYTGDNDVVNVYMDERARLEGLTLAREYKESIQQVQEEIKDLKRELKQADEDYKLGNIDGKSLKEFRKSVAEAIMESKAGLIEGYHSLIYKFQENTKESSKRAKEFAQAQIDRAREIQHNANSDMEGISAATQGTHPKNYNNAVMNALRSPFPTFQGMLKKFGEKNVEGKGYLYERFIPQATKAGDNEFRGKVAARVMIEGKLKEIYGKKMTIAKFMKQLREYGATVTYREGNEMKQFDLTKGQMLYIYMVNKMADGQMKLRRMGITDDVVAELMTKLPEEAVQFTDWAQNELLKDLRGKYNAVHERVFGAPMAAIENYFPIKIRKEARGEKGDVSEVGQEGKPSTVTGSIIKRTKNATAIDLSADAMQVLMEHIDDMEHWAAFAEFNRDINTLRNYKHFQNQVKNMTSVRYGSGEEMWKNFEKTAQIVSGTYRPSDSSIDRAVQNIAKGLTRSKINFRLFTATKQLLSAPAFWTDAGVKELAYCYVNPKGSFKWAKENLPGFAERWQGRTMGNEKLLKSDSDWEVWRNEFVEAATRWGMTPNAAIDALTVAQGARAVYMTKLEQFKKAGYTEQRANEKALQAAAEAYNESQQSSEGIYLSPLQVEGTALAAVFTTFKNSNFGYTRKTAQAIANIKRKMRKGYKEETIAFMTKQMIRDGLSEENAKKMAEKVYNKSKYKDVANVAMFGFGLPLLWEAGGMAIYLLFGDDDEEKEKMKKEIALRGSLGLLNGIPFGETMISAAMAVKEGDTKYFRLPELVAVSDIKNLAQVFNYDSVRGANDIVNMLTSMGVGVSPQVLTDILVALGDIEDFSVEELAMFVARLVNAPQSNLDRLMVDDAMENSAINADEIMRRYAEYKKSKNAPITQFFYPEEGEKKVIERYEKRFEKLLDERLENVVEDNDAYDMFYKGADARRKSELAKMRQKYLAEDKAKALEKLDSKELVDMVLNSTKKANKDINEEYFNLTNAEDEDTAFVIKIVKKALDDLKEGGKLSDKERGLLSSLNSLNYAINNAKKLMEQQPERAQEHMNKIRELRAKAIELINKYRNNE